MRNLSKRSSIRIAGIVIVAMVFMLPALFFGCKATESIMQVGSSIGMPIGPISSTQATSALKTAQAVYKSFQDITPEQEYYIGRAIGAIIVGKYKPYDNLKANTYLNVLGQTLAQASDRPETFGGYHFTILDSDEINAFAAPGGLIFVSRGMLRCCKHEDAVASVLAHEIAHVQFKHGLQAIKKSRITDALTTLALEGTKSFGGENLAKLTTIFEGSLSDITTTMINNGYSRAFESEADTAAVSILKGVGYDPNGLVEMLTVMDKGLKPGGLDFAKTHPSPQNRIAEIQKSTGASSEVKMPPNRQKRFVAALGTI